LSSRGSGKGKGRALASIEAPDQGDQKLHPDEHDEDETAPLGGWLKSLGKAAIGALCLAVAAGVVYGLTGGGRSELAAASGEPTASTTPDAATGRSGLALPRFVSLKADRVNVRRGPSSDHKVSWVFTRKGLPVEIIAEYDNWRRIRDSEGAEGWVYHSLLTGRRRVMVAPWSEGKTVPLRDRAEEAGSMVAILESGVMGDVESCDGTWCRVAVEGSEGWIKQEALWGVYPGEKVQE
jgi:SH3-like domain-containing protein